MSLRFSVDLDELDEVIAAIASYQAQLERQLSHLNHTVDGLQMTWLGVAADAQRHAHEEWARGARDMHEALGAMGAAAQVAQSNYVAAAEANRRMWGGLG